MTEEQGRRRAKIYIDADRFLAERNLPEGTHAVAIESRQDPPSVCIVVEGPALDLVPLGVESPVLLGRMGYTEIDLQAVLDLFTPLESEPEVISQLRAAVEQHGSVWRMQDRIQIEGT